MYIKVVVPANGLKVNHNDFVALHSIEKFSEGLRCLNSSGTAGGPIVDEFFSTVPGLNLVMCIIFHSTLNMRTLYFTHHNYLTNTVRRFFLQYE